MKSRPPFWFVISTLVLTGLLLVLAVVETDLKAQYFIDEGEFVSLLGLAFVAVAGAYLAWRGQLAASLPVAFPWLLYPLITQGDQIIDNLSMTAIRVVVHVLLAAIFGAPVAVLALALRPVLARVAPDRVRLATAMVCAALFAAEIVVAVLYLGALMIVTLAIMIVGVLVWGVRGGGRVQAGRRLTERQALAALAAGLVLSLGGYLYYKNLPGAYQGSPSFFMDPSKADSNYSFERIPVPPGPIRVPASADRVRAALDANARALERLLEGYHILDRNYTWDFHNVMFMRNRPLLPDYRRAGLTLVADAQAMRGPADAERAAARATLAGDDPLAALLDEVGAYVAFQFERAPVLEDMSARFDQTRNGLQHAAHLYEGEAKYLGEALAGLLEKHRRVLDAPELAPVTRAFTDKSHALYLAYAEHVVGF